MNEKYMAKFLLLNALHGRTFSKRNFTFTQKKINFSIFCANFGNSER